MANFKFFNISELVGRLSKAADENRYDQVTRNVHRIFESKAAVSPEAVVSSAELEKVYSSFSGLDPESKFRDYFEDVFKVEQASGQPNGLFFSRDDSFSADFRPSALEYQPKIEDQIKAASLIEIQNVISGSVNNPQYRFKGITRVADAGGFANWGVSFETGRGIAEIDVPVIVTDEAAYAPQKFTSADGAFAFTKDGINAFAKSYSGRSKQAGESNFLSQFGNSSIIPSEMFVSDVDQTPALEVTSLGGAMPMDESTTANIDGMEQSTVNAIVVARKAAIDKLSIDSTGKSVPSNVQLAYAGAIRFEDMPNDEKNFNGVVAFNTSKKTRFGIRTITIPVEVKGNVHVADSFIDQNQAAHPLNATSVTDFFVAAGEQTDTDVAEETAFNDAFLASMASYADLRTEIKNAIAGRNMARANAAITAVANRFDDQALKVAMDDYLQALNAVTATDSTNAEFANALKSVGVLL